MFVDDDNVVDKNSLDAAEGLIALHPDIALLCGRISVQFDDPPRLGAYDSIGSVRSSTSQKTSERDRGVRQRFPAGRRGCAFVATT